MITLTTNVKLETVAGINATVSNSLVGKSEGVTIATGEIAIDHSDMSSWNLDTAKGAAFNLDVMSLVNNVSAGEVKAVHIQCRTIKTEATHTEFPVPFNVSLGAASLGSMNQFTIGGVSGFTQSTLTISNVVVPANRRAVLTVVFAIDKA